MKSKEFKFIFSSFLLWRISLFVFLFLAAMFFPLQKKFLGGELGNYLKVPWFWAWSNFDGEHYLSIARNGYEQGEQAFFPLYPLLIRTVGTIFGGDLISLNLAGLIISNFALLFALYGIYKLLELDFEEKIVRLAIITLLLFPTSFYLGAVYTESLFLALSIWAFYFARKRNWFWASFLGMFAAGTRIIGVLLFPIFWIEALQGKGKKIEIKYLWLFLIPLGILAYMYYLKIRWGDPFVFLKTLPGFGEQRSATPIILPQVFYRYIFKILPNLDYSYFPATFSTLMEFIVSILFIVVSVWALFRARLSYALFLLGGYLLPTLSGSFSSLPRYVLALFPAFLLFAKYLAKTSALKRLLIFIFLGILLLTATMLFTRGYWIS